MIRTHDGRTSPSVVLSLVAALLVSSAVGVPRAAADQFQPSGDPPVVGVPVLSVQGESGAVDPSTEVVALQPAWETSTEAYHATVTVGAPSLTASLDRVVLCLYLPSEHDPEEDCDPSDYTSAQPDPTSLFLMQWERADAPGGGQPWPANGGTFGVIGDNRYVATGSVTDWGDGTQIALTLSFGFKVSSAMRKANDWALRVEAVDSGERSATTSIADIAVAYFQKVVTQRTAVDFGVLAVGSSSLREELATGEYSANSRAALSIDVSSPKFIATGPGAPEIEIPLRVRGVPGGPAANQLAIDCSPGATFDASGAVRLDSTGLQPLIPVVVRSAEAAATLPVHSCRAQYGGGIARANVALSNEVTVALAESAPVPSNVVASTDGTARTVSWNAPEGTSGGSPDVTVRSYVIEGSTDGGASFEVLRRVAPGEDAFDARSVTIDGLVRDLLYTFRVTANTDVGAGSATGNAPAQAPTVPQGLSATADASSITVAWQAPVGDGGAAITGYVVRGFANGSGTATTSQTVGAGARSATFPSGAGAGQVALSTDYRFTVTAVNTVGESIATPQSQIARIEVVEQSFSAGTGRTGTFQTYSVPTTGTYEVVVAGAQGGNTHGGRGAIVTARFDLAAGDQLVILTGQRGLASASGGAGGGGASAVWRRAGGTGTPTLLAIAGGGGGVWGGTGTPESAHGSTSSNGNDGAADPLWRIGFGGTGSQSGGGTSGAGGAGGGGGIGTGRARSNAHDGSDTRNASQITSTSAAGGTGSSTGGFGGGGGANNNGTTFLGGGGGGGYSGGGGSSSSSGARSAGGGGGSWVASSRVSQTIVSGASSGNAGAGSVVIRLG